MRIVAVEIYSRLPPPAHRGVGEVERGGRMNAPLVLAWDMTGVACASACGHVGYAKNLFDAVAVLVQEINESDVNLSPGDTLTADVSNDFDIVVRIKQ